MKATTRRKSKARKELEGNAGKRDLGAAPRVSPGEPKAPQSIAVDDDAMAEWRRITGILRDEGRLSEYDAGQIELACQAYSVVQIAYKAFEGRILTRGERGQVKNPALQIWRDATDAYRRGCESLGVNPGKRDTAKADPEQDVHGQLD